MISPPIRTTDIWGSGHYGAPREERTHNGVDLACYPRSTVLLHLPATVIRIGRPYAGTGARSAYKLIELRYDAQTTIEYMYVLPSVETGQILKRHQKLGEVQDLTKIYPGITNHYHLEIHVEGMPVNPIEWLDRHAKLSQAGCIPPD